jgi:RNA polymerase sigma factor (sigma-70 family)
VTPICDETLAQLYRETSDQQYFSAICDRHRERLINLLRGYVVGFWPDLDYDAIIAEVFVELHDFLSGTTPMVHLAAWLSTSAKQRVCAAMRWLGRQKRGRGRVRPIDFHTRVNHDSDEIVDDNQDPALVDKTQDTALEQVIRTEEVKLVHQAIACLPGQERRIVYCKLQGMTDEATSGELEIPVGTVKSAYHRARNTLQTLLSEKIGPDSWTGALRLIFFQVEGDQTVKEVPVYFVEIFSEAGGNADYHFLFSPAPTDLIGAIQGEMVGLQTADAEADPEADPDEAEHLHDQRQNRLAQLSRLREIAVVCKTLPADILKPSFHDICVAGVKIGSVHIRSFTALAQCESST